MRKQEVDNGFRFLRLEVSVSCLSLLGKKLSLLQQEVRY